MTTNRARTPRLLLVAALAVCLAGCPTPAQEGGLGPIDTASFPGRLGLLCRSGHSDPSGPSSGADAGRPEASQSLPSDGRTATESVPFATDAGGPQDL